MYFTQDSLLPENQQPLVITAAPFGHNGHRAIIAKTLR